MTKARRSWPVPALAAVLVILLVAGFFRLWQIGHLPPGLFGDEATDGLDALDVLAGRGAVFFPANFGREGLHIWIVAAAFRVLGVSALALRLPSAIAGILTALATYWLGCELLRSAETPRQFSGAPASAGQNQVVWLRPAALVPALAALYLSTSYYHVHFSRFGIRGVFTPLAGCLAFAAFWRAANARARLTAEQQDRSADDADVRRSEQTRGSGVLASLAGTGWYVVSGLFLGLSLHFYTASRFFPFFLLGFLVLQWLLALVLKRRDEALLRRDWAGILLLFVVAALVFAPLGLYFIQHPGSFSERASTVSAFNTGSPLQSMGQAALANVLQFFVPGRGDQAQFYNLPGRAVFDPLTALLALVGIGVLLWRWRQPAALFLLTWWPALLLPSFLATDRYPTLPRVLGTLPGVYFFPAAGLAAVAWLLSRAVAPRTGGPRSAESGPFAAADPPGAESGWAQRNAEYRRPGLKRPDPEAVRNTNTSASSARPVGFVGLAVIAAALLVHGGLAYRDYFTVWGPSQATFDAFDGDMTAAADWLAVHPAEGHVYLSSDIYRHPTFMLLHEHATVTQYFQVQDRNLSWFDGRSILPLPQSGITATYLIASSSPLQGRSADFVREHSALRGTVSAPGGTPALSVLEMSSDNLGLALAGGPQDFGAGLTLLGGRIDGQPGAPGPLLRLLWQTAGPDMSRWPGFRMQVEGRGASGATWQVEVPFDAFRPSEWVPGGRFLSSQTLAAPPAAVTPALRIRLIDIANDRVLALPGADPEGWHSVMVAAVP